MFVEDLHVIKPSAFGPYTTIQAAIAAALASNPPEAVMITPDYAGTDTYTNASGVTIIDLRQGGANTGSQFGSGTGSVATVSAATLVAGSGGITVGTAGAAGAGVTVGGVKSGIASVAAAAAPITAAIGGTFVTTLNLPGGAGAPFEQVPFVVKASGFVTFPAGTYTATIQPLLYAASGPGGFTASASAAIYSAAAIAITFASATLPVTKPYSLEAHLISDSTSKSTQGWSQGVGYVGGAALTNAVLAITAITQPVPITGAFNFTAAAAIPLQFQFGIVGGAGFPATGVINLGSFFIEA